MNRKAVQTLCAAIAIGLAGTARAQTAPSSIQRGTSSPFGSPSQPAEPAQQWRPIQREKAAASPTVAPAPPSQTPPNPARPAQSARVAPRILSIVPAPRPFVVAPACRVGTPLVTLNVVLRNVGSAPVATRGLPLIALDEGAVAWSGSAPLPQLAPGASANVSIPVYPPTYAPRAGGTHHFTVRSALGSAQAPIAVTLPAGVCGGLASRFKASVVITKAAARPPAQTSAAGYTAKQAGTITPRVSPGGGISAEELRLAGRLRQNRPAPPSGVASTADPTTCTQHGGLGGGLACAALLPQGRLALVWTWSGTAADGFNVYRVDSGQRARVGRQANGRDVTLFVLDPVPADGYSGKCYAVSAYRGAEESDLSAPACTDAGRIMQTATLTPGAADSSTRANQNQMGIANAPAGEIYVYDSGVYAAGYDYYREVNFLGDFARSQYSRLAILFDVGPISNKVVYTAHLKLTVDTTKVNQDPDPKVNSDHSTSCVKRVGLATANWWLYRGDWIEVPAATTPRINQVGPNVDIDVTDIVRGWAQAPNSNFGIVLMGDNENLSQFTNAACRTAYDPASVQLLVQFF